MPSGALGGKWKERRLFLAASIVTFPLALVLGLQHVRHKLALQGHLASDVDPPEAQRPQGEVAAGNEQRLRVWRSVAVQDVPSFIQVHGELARALFDAASGRDKAFRQPDLGLCVDAYHERHPSETHAVGDLAVTVKVGSGVAEVVDIIRDSGDGDDALGECLQERSDWMQRPVPFDGDEEGIYRFKWPYRFGMIPVRQEPDGGASSGRE